jgi:hypothetical protein
MGRFGAVFKTRTETVTRTSGANEVSERREYRRPKRLAFPGAASL